MFPRVPHILVWTERKLTVLIVNTEGQKPGRYYYLPGFLIKKGQKMHWIYLLTAGIFEISWAVGLKFSHGFTQFIPSALTIICMIASFYFLALALKNLPLGTAYAIWTGIGTLGVNEHSV